MNSIDFEFEFSLTKTTRSFNDIYLQKKNNLFCINATQEFDLVSHPSLHDIRGISFLQIVKRQNKKFYIF